MLTKPTIFTIGHSTRPIEEFVNLLQTHKVSRLVDVRTVPRSRHNPQFERTSLSVSLPKADIEYVHLPELGGLRRPKPDSVNIGWRNTSFRGYADYMQTPEFTKALEKLTQWSNKYQITIMCAEAVPWRCHRSLIADALLVRGICVEDIMSGMRRQVHKLTPFAQVRGSTITYPADPAQADSKKSTTTRGTQLELKLPELKLIARGIRPGFLREKKD